MREYAFELSVCAALEAESDGIIARQLGTHSRILDVVEVRPGPEFEQRTKLTSETVPAPAIESDVGVGRSRRPKAAFDVAPERASAIAERAIEIGFFEADRRNGKQYVRQTVRYPDWIGGLRAFENKPDLGRPGDLEFQLRKDVSLGLFDEVVVVTESYVTGAHLNRIPDEIGIWRFDPETGGFERVRPASQLPTTRPGIAVLEESPAQTDIEPVDSDEKASLRRRIAERAYGKGWRPAELPECACAEPASPAFDEHRDMLPYCTWKGRFVDSARECGPECGGYSAVDSQAADVEAVRDRRTPWVRDPAGFSRRQVGLDRFQ